MNIINLYLYMSVEEQEFICFYHSPCDDGEMASYIWKSKFPNTTFHPWDHTKIEENLNTLYQYYNKNIVFLDYCPKPEYLINDSNNYLVIDHHKNAVETLEISSFGDNLSIHYDNSRSGCMLTWNYLYPGEDYPISVYHVGMNDLFKFEHPDTDNFCIGKQFFQLDSEMLLLMDIDSQLYKNIVEYGRCKSSEYRIEAMGYFMHLEYENESNLSVLKINCDNYKLIKYMVEYARKKYSNYYNVLKIQNSNGKVSLRSIDGTHVDVIARKYGGNGHPLAAGYNNYK
jgi:oligoribonuclease NrnB/cAMP/cGMP phosphodiesterase (DHH superfamily)